MAPSRLNSVVIERGAERLLVTALRTFNELHPLARDRDEQELQNAMDSVQDGCFQGGYKQQSTLEQIAELKRLLSDTARDLNEHLPKIIEMYDYVELIKLEVKPGWDEVVDELKQVRAEMDKLLIDDWQGKSADAYRRTIQDQMTRTDAQITLSGNTGGSIDSVAMLQDWIIKAAENEGISHASTYSATRTTVNQPAEQFSKGSWFNPNANAQEFSFSFYQRTAAMINSFNPLAQGAKQLSDGSGWRSSSQEIAQGLGQALEQARSGQEITVALPNIETPAVNAVEVAAPNAEDTMLQR